MSRALDPVFSNELKMSRDQERQMRQFEEHLKTSGCTGCSLHKERTSKPVPGQGSGRIMFVGHRIGQQEANRSKPAIGEASQYGFKMFTDILPIREDLRKRQARDAVLEYSYVTNAARCGRDANPSTAHWSRCGGSRGPNWLAQEIGMVDPEIVVFWNLQAARAVLPSEPPSRGQVEHMKLGDKERPVMLMTHPVRVAREPEEKMTVQGDFKRLARWLWDQGFMERRPQIHEKENETDHRLVTTSDGLEKMKRDLWDKTWVALDTETFYSGTGDLQEFLQMMVADSHAANKGALLWYREGFETTCYQICGLGPEGSVERTYTVAMRFRDRMTGTPYQDITPEKAIGALDELFRHRPQGYARQIAMWNALFDCPVLTREGLDLWGLTGTEYEVRIHDGQIYMGRMHEHMGGKEGRTTLDNASSVYLQERKGSFSSEFDVHTFAYTQLDNPEMRQKLLSYTGEDPRKTLLVTLALFEEMDEHIESRKRHLSSQQTGLPEMGFEHYDRPAENYTGARIRDVGIPMDHQMIPMIGEMEMLGFEFDTSAVEEAGRYADSLKRQLLDHIRDVEPGFNPNSASDTIEVMKKAMAEVAGEINRIADEDEKAWGDLIGAYQVDAWRVDGSLKESDLIKAFEQGYSELDAQKDTIENKFLIYHQVSWELLKEAADKHNHELNIAEWAQPESLKTFFTRVFLYKQVDKKYSTYFERFENLVDQNSVFHPGYLLISTLSGRFSGNFQNVPRGGEEDLEFVEELLFTGVGMEEPDDEQERKELITEYNRFDVRQACRPVQPKKLNRQFQKMNLPWQVDESKRQVLVGADYAGQEDRMAFAQSGDETKARLLSNPELDTHFYNVAFCFGDQAGFDTSTEEGVMEAYHHFTKHRDIKKLEKEIREALEEQDFGPNSDYVEQRREKIKKLKAQKKDNKSQYRTPMKTVHYASQYGAGVEKLHSVLKPLFMRLGHAQPLDTPVLSPEGWKPMGEVDEGDYVIGQDGEPTKVIATYSHEQKEVYKVTFSDGSTTRACGDHLWCVQTPYRRSQEKGFRTMTTEELASDQLFYKNGDPKWQIPTVEPVQYGEKDLPVDPYVLGVLLGDGSLASTGLALSTDDQFIIDELEQRSGYEVYSSGDNQFNYRFRLGKQNGGSHEDAGSQITDALRDLGLYGKTSLNKFVPEVYLRGSVRQRLDLLQGLMDSDGSVSEQTGVPVFYSTSEDLIEAVRELVRSLGGYARQEAEAREPVGGDVEVSGYGSHTIAPSHTVYRLNFSLNGLNPCKLPRKAERFKVDGRGRYRSIVSIERCGSEDAQCITVDNDDSLYVTENHIMTHNTWTIEDTQRLKERYDELYSGVVAKREEIFDWIESVPYLEYPTWGAIRHANVNFKGEVQDALSVANAYNQGACAYMTKTAMLRMRHLISLNAERWDLVQAGGTNYVGVNLQVHDEIAVTCPASLAVEVARCLESAMKMIVEPGRGQPYYDTEKEDYRGESGWLVIPDKKYEGRTLFDADGEIKATVAKAKTLASGQPNLLASMEEPESIEKFQEKYPPTDVNEGSSLTLAKAGHTEFLI